MNTTNNDGPAAAAPRDDKIPPALSPAHPSAAGEAGSVDLNTMTSTDGAAAQTLNHRLQRQIDTLQAKLDYMAAEHAAEKQRNMADLELFCRSATHDLRNQVSAVQGFTRLLQLQAPDLDGDARDSLQWIVRGSDQLATMLDALMELARLEYRMLACEHVDLTSLAHDVAQALAHSYPERRIQLTIADMPAVIGDPRLLRIALQNLMDNAWKYTRKVAQPRVEVGSLRDAEGMATYYVRDNGVGFPARDAAKAFLPFKRLSTAEEFPGTGIGLATVKRIVAKHDGRVWAECSPSDGTTFYFTLGNDGAVL